MMDSMPTPPPHLNPDLGHKPLLSRLDPSPNVQDMVDAVEKRQDDLRAMSDSYYVRMANLRNTYEDRLSRYEDKLVDAEAKRIDAIRAVDVGAVATAATAAETRANTLAQQVQVSADALRITLDSKISPILEAIAALQRAQYETAGGKAQVSDSREGSGNKAIWAGVGIALFVGSSTIFLSIVGIVITILITNNGKI